MAATVTRIPVAMKRGRKVSRGPTATVVPIRPVAAQGREFPQLTKAEEEVLVRIVEKQAAWRDFVRNHPQVITFPATRWARIPCVVSELMMETRREVLADAELTALACPLRGEP